MPQQTKVEHVGKPKYRVDRFGRRYICVRRAPNVWDVGLATARKWLAQGVSWRDMKIFEQRASARCSSPQGASWNVGYFAIQSSASRTSCTGRQKQQRD